MGACAKSQHKQEEKLRIVYKIEQLWIRGG